MARHPWEITLREFIEIVRRDYGIEIDPASAAVAAGSYLSKDRRAYPLPVMDLDAPVPLPMLRFLCKRFWIPPEDFRLDPEDED